MLYNVAATKHVQFFAFHLMLYDNNVPLSVRDVIALKWCKIGSFGVNLKTSLAKLRQTFCSGKLESNVLILEHI